MITSPHPEIVDRTFQMYEKQGWKTYLKPLREELELTKENAKIPRRQDEKRSEYDKLVDQVLNAYATNTMSVEISNAAKTYFVNKFKSGGFDGWSNSYLQLLRLKRIATILSLNSLFQELEGLEFVAQSGGLCSSTEQQKHITPCLP